MPEPPACCLCGQPCEPWTPGESGWGHNPEPLAGSPKRCCNDCNATKVIPARLGRLIPQPPLRTQRPDKENQ